MLRVYRALPPTGAVSQAGIMPGRRQRAIPLIIQTHSVEDAVVLPARIRWPGSRADADAGVVVHQAVDVELGDAVGTVR